MFYFRSSRAPAKHVSVAVSGCCLLGDGELQPPVESSASRNSKPMKTASFRSQCDSQLNTGGQSGGHNPPVTRVSSPRHTHTGAGLRNVVLPTHSQAFLLVQFREKCDINGQYLKHFQISVSILSLEIPQMSCTYWSPCFQLCTAPDPVSVWILCQSARL